MVKFLKRFYLALIMVFLYAPIFVLILFSFNEKKIKTWGNFHFSLKPYIDLFHSNEILSSLAVTLVIALAAAVLSTVLGTAASFGLFRMRPAARQAVLSATYMPMMNADIVTGISLMLMFATLKIPLGWFSLLMSHITFCVPYVIASVLPKLFSLNSSIYEAALDLGASDSYAYRKIIIPEIMPGIASGFLLSITLSIDDFMISYYNSGDELQNISTFIYSRKQGVPPTIYALSTIIFLFLLVLIVGINIRQNNDKKKKTEAVKL